MADDAPRSDQHVSPTTARQARRGPRTTRQAFLLGLGAMAVFLVGALIATFFVGGGTASRADTSANRNGVVGFAPLGKGTNLVGKSLSEAGLLSLDGTVTDLKTVAAGRPVLINFFSRTCVPCVKEMPDLQAHFTAAAGKLHMIGVDVGDTQADTTAFVKQTGVTYPIVRDPQGLVLSAYGVGSLPTTLAVDANGKIVAQRFGAFGDGELAAFISSHVPGR